MKKKNYLEIDYIYKNKYGIKLSKSNDNIYPSNNNNTKLFLKKPIIKLLK